MARDGSVVRKHSALANAVVTHAPREPIFSREHLFDSRMGCIAPARTFLHYQPAKSRREEKKLAKSIGCEIMHYGKLRVPGEFGGYALLDTSSACVAIIVHVTGHINKKDKSTLAVGRADIMLAVDRFRPTAARIRP